MERAASEKSLPLLDKIKFLVPEDLTMFQLTAIMRCVSACVCLCVSVSLRECVCMCVCVSVCEHHGCVQLNWCTYYMVS